MNPIAAFTAAFLAGAIFATPVRATDTTFTYQGRLASDGVPLDGTADLGFALYDAAVGGTQVAPLAASSAHPISNGLFKIDLDFGAAAFDGSERWLEVAVDGVALTPRERFNAFSVHTRGLDVDAAGNVDIDGMLSANMLTFDSDMEGIRFPNTLSLTEPMIMMFEDASVIQADRVVLAHSPIFPTVGLAYMDAPQEFRFQGLLGPRVTIRLSAAGPALKVTHDETASSPWAIIVDNPDQPTYVTGMRVSDSGFFEITNRIDGYTGFARLNSAGSWTVVSDRRMKKDITPLGSVLDEVLELEPVTYRYRTEDDDAEPHIGFVAQDVQQRFPSFVTEGDTLTLDYGGMSTIAIAALQELAARKDAEIAALRERAERLETLVHELMEGR